MQSLTQSTLTTYLLARREAILDNWRTVCEEDPGLHTVSVLSREEFNDRVPTILNILTERLRGEKESINPVLVASEHGLHRWHKGYSLHELLKEVGYLYQSLFNELQTYQDLYHDADLQALMYGYREIGRLSQETVEGSVARYNDLERTAAGSRVDALRAALDQMNELARQRTNALRTSNHDLRSSLGIIQGAAFMLDLDQQSPEQRSQLMNMLNRNLTSVQTLLQDLMSLARLDAGQEPLETSSFDLSKLMNDLVRDAQPLAAQRKLTLLGDGPDGLFVEGDLLKVQQIIHNLLLNALKNTPSGIVSVSWAREDNHRWTVSVQDSGSGLSGSIPQKLLDNLAPTRDSTSALESQFDMGNPPTTSAEIAPTSSEPSDSAIGIGLHIVKRLCEEMAASMDIEKGTEGGMLIRIRFPMSYGNLQKE